MGNLGEPQKIIEVEESPAIPDTVPAERPATTPAPAREPEKVPA